MHDGCGCGPGSTESGAGETKNCEWCRTPMGMGHARACALNLAAEVLFFLGIIALVAAWVTNYQGTTWLGFESEHLFHDAIAFLILSLMAKMKLRSYKMKFKLGGCGGGGCGGGSESGCGGGGCGESSGGGCGTEGGCNGGCGEGACGCK